MALHVCGITFYACIVDDPMKAVVCVFLRYFIDFYRQRGRGEKERHIHVRAKHRLPARECQLPGI